MTTTTTTTTSWYHHVVLLLLNYYSISISCILIGLLVFTSSFFLAKRSLSYHSYHTDHITLLNEYIQLNDDTISSTLSTDPNHHNDLYTTKNHDRWTESNPEKKKKKTTKTTTRHHHHHRTNRHHQDQDVDHHHSIVFMIVDALRFDFAYHYLLISFVFVFLFFFCGSNS
jgi:hypothetical protein